MSKIKRQIDLLWELAEEIKQKQIKTIRKEKLLRINALTTKLGE